MITDMTTPYIKGLIQEYAKGKVYLKIGVFRGATLEAASEVAKHAIGIDNWSQFNEGQNKEITLKRLKGNYTLIEGDCFAEETKMELQLRVEEHGKIDVLFLDGDHRTEATKEALLQYLPYLKRYGIIVKQSGGRLADEVKQEFIQLCQQHFNYRPDMTCGKCIYKHAVKLHNL